MNDAVGVALTILWTATLAAMLVVGGLIFAIIYTIKAVVDFANWFYALCSYIWDYGHGNYEQL